MSESAKNESHQLCAGMQLKIQVILASCLSLLAQIIASMTFELGLKLKLTLCYLLQ